MNKRAWMLSGFIAFASLQTMNILAGIIMGSSSGLTLNQNIRLSIVVTILVGFFGVLLALIFSKIEKYIPFKNFTIKVIFYFCLLNFLFTVIKSINAVLTLNFIISSLLSIIAAVIFSQSFKMLQTK
ncbi:MAG: hypothetical protein V6Z89_25755 [Desulfobacter sp.]